MMLLIQMEMASSAGEPLSGSALLAGGVTRTPVGFVDLDAQSGKIVKATRVAKGTAWKDVPTPEI